MRDFSEFTQSHGLIWAFIWVASSNGNSLEKGSIQMWSLVKRKTTQDPLSSHFITCPCLSTRTKGPTFWVNRCFTPLPKYHWPDAESFLPGKKTESNKGTFETTLSFQLFLFRSGYYCVTSWYFYLFLRQRTTEEKELEVDELCLVAPLCVLDYLPECHLLALELIFSMIRRYNSSHLTFPPGPLTRRSAWLKKPAVLIQP